ncbi:MAG TPA: hypothetical protein VHK90_13615, partial [Thermoanaerobaculia bacterium]|nr:hypothetical protein [Thermoanaerobaculia bacterium]
MKRLTAMVAVMLFGVVSARAAKVSCDDDLPHVLNVGVPRTSMSDQETLRLPQLLQTLFGAAYEDRCGAGKELQIHLAFGSDYEVLDWLERGSVDAGIVPHLSLFLLTHRNRDGFRELSPATAEGAGILRPLAPAPSCRTYANGRWTACDANAKLDAFADALADGRESGDTRVMFASHLSSTGFLHPIERVARRLAELKPTDEEAAEFWTRFFAVARFRIDSDPALDPFQLALAEEKVATNLTILDYPGEETIRLTRQQPTANRQLPPYAQHFIITPDAAQLLPRASFVEPWNGGMPQIDESVTTILAQNDLPAPFAQLVHANATYGTRTFSFTILESMRLLQQQQRSSGQKELALVLPGGGVKAAY